MAGVLDLSTAGRVLDLSATIESVDGSFSDSTSPTQQTITLATDVLFAFGKSELTPAAQALITTVAQMLQASHGPLMIDGYTDSVGDGGYNQTLSERRAGAVRDALAPLIPPGTTIAVTGHGASDPVAPNTTPSGADNPDGRAKNRRVTITNHR